MKFATKEEAFKAGFLLKLAELGVTPGEFQERLVKSAIDFQPLLTGALQTGSGIASKGVDVARDALSAGKDIMIEVGGYMVPASIFLPLFAGAGLGFVHSKATSPSSEDIDVTRQRDLLRTYQTLTDEAKSRNQRTAAEDDEGGEGLVQ